MFSKAALKSEWRSELLRIYDAEDYTEYILKLHWIFKSMFVSCATYY